MFKKIIEYILRPLRQYQERRRRQRQIEELRKRDPFIY